MKSKTARAAGYGALVWDELERARPTPLTLPDLTRRTGLTIYQVQNGLEHINRQKQLEKKQPIAYYPGGGYVLPDSYAELLPWQLNRWKDLLTRARTSRTRHLAALEAWPKDVRKRTVKDIDRLIEDLSDVLAAEDVYGTT